MLSTAISSLRAIRGAGEVLRHSPGHIRTPVRTRSLSFLSHHSSSSSYRSSRPLQVQSLSPFAFRSLHSTSARNMSDNPAVTSENPAGLMPIDIGDELPPLALRNENDEDVVLSLITEHRGAIIFLVPKVDTPGCTTQACAFRDGYADYTGVNYEVYCLSADTPAEQKAWKDKQKFPYHLISDPDRVLIGALGAFENGRTTRSHFIFEKGTGKLIDKKIPVTPTDSPKFALEFIRSYEASQK